jgi:uncharacterized protein YjbJ (UPF0337 family)
MASPHVDATAGPVGPANAKESVMGSGTDKIKGMANEAVGNVKQGVGKATGNDRLRAEGAAQEAKGEIQQAVGKAKDTAKDAANRAADTINRKL